MRNLAVRTGLVVGVVLAVLAVSTYGVGGLQRDTATVNAATVKAADGTPLTLEQLTAIQPGLGVIMIEYGTRFDNLWFAAKKKNWNMAAYQLKEMLEAQEVAEVTRPARAPLLKAFENGSLANLDKAIDSKKAKTFVKAYDATIAGCNSCHAASTDSKGANFKFIKITRPKGAHFQNVDWRGQK